MLDIVNTLVLVWHWHDVARRMARGEGHFRRHVINPNCISPECVRSCNVHGPSILASVYHVFELSYLIPNDMSRLNQSNFTSYISHAVKKLLRYIAANTTRKYDSRRAPRVVARFFVVQIRRFRDAYRKVSVNTIGFNIGLRRFLRHRCDEFRKRAELKLDIRPAP